MVVQKTFNKLGIGHTENAVIVSRITDETDYRLCYDNLTLKMLAVEYPTSSSVIFLPFAEVFYVEAPLKICLF